MLIDLILFFCITFMISWGIWGVIIWSGSSSQLLFWIAGFGPTLAALSLTAFKNKVGGIRNLLKPGQPLRPVWYLFSLLGPPLVICLALMIHVGLGGSWPEYADKMHLVTSLEQWPGIFVVYLYIFIFSALGEEIGWRRYAQPRLQAYFTPFSTSLILGLIWAVWHLPLFWIADAIQNQLPLSWFLLQILGSTFLYTWMYNCTNGNLLISLFFHTSSNAAIGLLPVLALDNGGSIRQLWLAVLLLWIGVGIILLVDRRRFFSRAGIHDNLPI